MISLNPANAVKKFFNNKSHYQDKALGTASILVPCGGLYDSYISSKQGKGNAVTDTLGAVSCIPLAGGIANKVSVRASNGLNKVNWRKVWDTIKSRDSI